MLWSLLCSSHTILMRAIISVITSVEESDGWGSSMLWRPIVSNDRHNLDRYCPKTSETAKGLKERWCHQGSNPGQSGLSRQHSATEVWYLPVPTPLSCPCNLLGLIVAWIHSSISLNISCMYWCLSCARLVHNSEHWQGRPTACTFDLLPFLICHCSSSYKSEIRWDGAKASQYPLSGPYMKEIELNKELNWIYLS